MKLKNRKGQAIFSNLILLIIFLVVVCVGGLLAGIIYYDMNAIQSALLQVNFPIPIQETGQVSANVTDFQDIMQIVVYPILGLKSSLPYLTYFMVFAFIIALGMTAYVSSKNSVFFVLHVLFTLLIVYFSIILSNAYAGLLANPFINAMMLNFTIYNKVMLSLPKLIFFTSLLFGVIAFVNLIKPQSPSTTNSLQYGGDY
jgi:hypothetical protein